MTSSLSVSIEKIANGFTIELYTPPVSKDQVWNSSVTHFAATLEEAFEIVRTFLK